MKKYKDFELPVLVGLAAIAAWYFFGYRTMTIAAVEGRESLDQLRQRAAAVSQRGVPTPAALAKAQDALGSRTQSLEALAGRLRFQPPKWAEEPLASGTALGKFPSLLADEEKSLAALLKKSQTRLGFRDEPRDEAVAREYLVRLAIVSTVLRTMSESGIKGVETVDPFADAFDTREATAVEGAFVAPYRVAIRFRGTAEAIFKFLHAAQTRTPFFGLAGFTISPSGSGGDMMTAEISLEGYEIRPGGALPKEEAE